MAVAPTQFETPRARLAKALELLGACYGVRPPDQEDEPAVLAFSCA